MYALLKVFTEIYIVWMGNAFFVGYFQNPAVFC